MYRKKWKSIFWPHNFTTKISSIYLTSDVVNPCFWCLNLAVIPNTDFSIDPQYSYLWFDIGIFLCLYSLEKLLIKTLSSFLIWIHINFKCLASSGTLLKGILITLPYQMFLLVFTQKIEPSVIISSSLSKKS